VTDVMLTDLADVLRAAGLTVVEVDGWKARGHGPMSEVASIICHHTAGPTSSDHKSLDTVINGRPGLSGPLGNLFLARSGTWYTVAAGVAYHAGVVDLLSHSNPMAIGIEAENDGIPPLDWPLVETDSYARGCAALARHYGVPLNQILGHKEVAFPRGRKSDPDFDMTAFRSKVAHYLTPEADMPLDTADKAWISAQLVAQRSPTAGATVTALMSWLIADVHVPGQPPQPFGTSMVETHRWSYLASLIKPEMLLELSAKVDALLARPAVDVDEEALAAALTQAGFSAEAIAQANLAAVRAALAQ
jgi:N-acetylmuramoyl-L-alanine amidase